MKRRGFFGGLAAMVGGAFSGKAAVPAGQLYSIRFDCKSPRGKRLVVRLNEPPPPLWLFWRIQPITCQEFDKTYKTRFCTTQHVWLRQEPRPAGNHLCVNYRHFESHTIEYYNLAIAEREFSTFASIFAAQERIFVGDPDPEQKGRFEFWGSTDWRKKNPCVDRYADVWQSFKCPENWEWRPPEGDDAAGYWRWSPGGGERRIA